MSPKIGNLAAKGFGWIPEKGSVDVIYGVNIG